MTDGLLVCDGEDLEYDDKKKPEENQARAMFAIARRLHNLAVSVEGLGLNGAFRSEGGDQRGCLEKLAQDLPLAIERRSQSFKEP